MALTALRLTEAKYAWVVRPVEVEEVCVCVSGWGGGVSMVLLSTCIHVLIRILAMK